MNNGVKFQQIIVFSLNLIIIQILIYFAMMKSVLVLGDAGALNYVQEDVPKSAFNFCCSCTLPKNEKETNLTPIKKRTIKKRNSSTPSLKSQLSRTSMTSSKAESTWKWSHDIIALYSNTDAMQKGMRSQNTQSLADNQFKKSALTFGSASQAKTQSQISLVQEDHQVHEEVIDKYNHIFDQKMKQAKKKLDQQLDQNNPDSFKQTSNFQNQYRYQLEMIRQRIKFDVAWQIFDDVNANNDTQQHIELSCLDYEDAIIIAKQKIYELAKFASIKSYQTTGSPSPFVLNIKCAEDHLILIEDEYGRTPLKNCILEMIQKELAFDHFYIPMQKTILVKVDHKSIQRFDKISK